MQIEVGKFYKTRDGRKVGPISHQDDNTYPWVIRFSERSHEGTKVAVFKNNGKNYEYNTLDLVEEWTETPKFIVGKAYKLRDGSRAVVTAITDDSLHLYRDEEEYICLWAISGTVWKAHMKREDKHDIISEWSKGPIQETTIRTIVPGVYGCVSVIASTTGEMRYHIEPYMTAEQLRDAAKVFSDIAAWLEEQK